MNTADDLAARLAVVPPVLEAHGLDVAPSVIDRLRAAGDPDSAAMLERIIALSDSHGRRFRLSYVQKS